MKQESKLGCLAWLFCLSVSSLAALDFGFVVRIVYVATVPHFLSPFWAIFIGCILATVVCAVFIAGQGSTVLEFVVPALILLVLLMSLYPVAVRLSEKRRVRPQKHSVKQHAISPQRSLC